ncbi:5-oxoprolinase/urea amidolyase family protein [Mycolicibacterium houstonense]|uniref:5-oxoprolinase/urea amidolyase family protein n=1 Tax=Mycolicibacterium houstonense TaxID=146021 RepID=UPI00083723DC|nr:5-oxoprolinase/urea amidolyase family protein [Mycolicibacterium houstonense]
MREFLSAPRVRTMEIIRPGMATTVQDWPGRAGYWQIGVPPSGPMDDVSFRLANIAVGNPEGAPGLEATMGGPALRFDTDTWVCVTGAPAPVTVDGRRVAQWVPVLVAAGQVLDVGMVEGPGLRIYLAMSGGLQADEYLGSAATFTLGRFGGHEGRVLAVGDKLEINDAPTGTRRRILFEEQPAIVGHWNIGVTVGPHSAPEFFTRNDIDTLLNHDYEVHFNSDRTGVRLIGPKPEWARPDGGEAGLHPSNIHDNAYSVGSLDFTGDTPILLGPDGPSLGGFVCPVTVVAAERWKLGQLAPGATIRFVPVVEYGEMRLDLALRARAHALHHALEEHRPDGLIDLTPGIRSLQVKVDPARLPQSTLVPLLAEIEASLPAAQDLVVPSRTVRLPLSWDDPSTREAIERYMHGVRADAPWCPWNIEFIRRMNGLESVDDVHRIVYDAEYLVLGLGDVYLGAPVATPLDPRHRLVTTKYNPARTWTPENAVGIGGAYLCIYGMEGPGGYQFVGRTTQIWNHRHPLVAQGFDPEHPWLLRFFDRIQWYAVSAEELLDLRADMAAGRGRVEITDGTFSLAEHEHFLTANAADIAATRAAMETARTEERERWAAAGEFARKESA